MNNITDMLQPYKKEETSQRLGVLVGVRNSGKSRSICIPGEENRWDPPQTIQCFSCNRCQLTNNNAYKCVEFQMNPGDKVSYTVHTYRHPKMWTYKNLSNKYITVTNFQ